MNSQHYIVFQCGAKVYGLASASIKEVGRTRELRLNQVPKTPAYIKGIINLRGEVVPIIDLQEKLESREPTPTALGASTAQGASTAIGVSTAIGASTAQGASTALEGSPVLRPRLIIVRLNNACYGLLADQILGHRTPASDEILPPTAEMNELTPYIEAIVREPELTYFVLDLNRLF